MDPFPNVIDGRTFFPKSDATADYNCIAWAVSHEVQPIWPDDRKQLGWPEQIAREETLEAFISFFELCDFSVCQSGILERGFEKVAIYIRNGLVTHVARQLPNGVWTSKMAQGPDAEHPTPETLCGDGYGLVSRYMRRLAQGKPKLPKLFPSPPLIRRP
jgi:hypothetical protein